MTRLGVSELAYTFVASAEDRSPGPGGHPWSPCMARRRSDRRQHRTGCRSEGVTVSTSIKWGDVTNPVDPVLAAEFVQAVERNKRAL